MNPLSDADRSVIFEKVRSLNPGEPLDKDLGDLYFAKCDKKAKEKESSIRNILANFEKNRLKEVVDEIRTLYSRFSLNLKEQTQLNQILAQASQNLKIHQISQTETPNLTKVKRSLSEASISKEAVLPLNKKLKTESYRNHQNSFRENPKIDPPQDAEWRDIQQRLEMTFPTPFQSDLQELLGDPALTNQSQKARELVKSSQTDNIEQSRIKQSE